MASLEGNERGDSTDIILESKYVEILLKIMPPTTPAFEKRRKRECCEDYVFLLHFSNQTVPSDH